MNDTIKQGKIHFDKGNYKKALNFFEAIRKDDEYYEIASMYKAYCFIELKEYKRALKIINLLIEKTPYNDLLWFNKVTCHVFLKQDSQAFKALSELERIIDMNDKSKLVYMAKMYNLLDDFDKALMYCNKALAIDENYKEALHEKSLIAISTDNNEMISDVADKLLRSCEDNLLDILPVVLLKIFSKNYRQAFDLVENLSKEDIGIDTIELFKSIIFKRICEDLTINILTNNGESLSIDDALFILFDYIEIGKNSGNFKGVKYYIV